MSHRNFRQKFRCEENKKWAEKKTTDTIASGCLSTGCSRQTKNCFDLIVKQQKKADDHPLLRLIHIFRFDTPNEFSAFVCVCYFTHTQATRCRRHCRCRRYPWLLSRAHSVCVACVIVSGKFTKRLSCVSSSVGFVVCHCCATLAEYIHTMTQRFSAGIQQIHDNDGDEQKDTFSDASYRRCSLCSVEQNTEWCEHNRKKGGAAQQMLGGL